jgi:glucosamine 6-phosphate synthetase-like amidotransferase/phosphosugar isomerase protein
MLLFILILPKIIERWDMGEKITGKWIAMNEDMIKTLKESEKHRTNHPYWVWESIQEIPDILSKCLESSVIEQIDEVVKEIKNRNIDKFVLLGRGSSYFLALSEKYLFDKITNISTSCAVTNVFESYQITSIDEHTALFSTRIPENQREIFK